MEKEAIELKTMRYIENDTTIDDQLYIFTNVTGRRRWPEGNRELMEKKDGEYVQDAFRHGQYLVITEGNKKVLVSGCAHNGIFYLRQGNGPYTRRLVQFCVPIEKRKD